MIHEEELNAFFLLKYVITPLCFDDEYGSKISNAKTE
jgi:hypothetical protein